MTALTSSCALVAQAQDNPEVETVNEGDEIVVTGIRQSLAASIDRKRNDNRIIDSIVAEDIGKLPDENIAEALQRITGVSIESELGVGSSVSIRGLPQNRIEVNGRSTLGEGRQGVNFQDFPSDLLEAVDVVKSPTPKMIEGALGGTINLRTKRPLSLKKRVISGRVQGEYADLNETVDLRASGQIGDKFDLGKSGEFGVLVNLSYEDRTLRSDTTLERLRVRNINDQFVTAAEDHRININLQDRERIATNVSLEWAPSSGKGSVYTDLTFTDFASESFNYGYFTSDSGIDVNEPFEIQANGDVDPFVNRNVRLRSWANSDPRETESFSGAIGGNYELTPSLEVSSEVSYAYSQSLRSPSSVQLPHVNVNDIQDGGSGRGAPEEIRFDVARSLRGLSDFPSVIPQNFRSDTGRNELPLTAEQASFTNPDNYILRNYRDLERVENNFETAVRFDGSYTDGKGRLDFISSIDFGGRYTDRGRDFREFNTNIDNLHRFARDENGDPIFFTASDLAEVGFNVTTLPFDIFPGSDSSFITNDFVVFDPNQLRDDDEARIGFNALLEGVFDRNGNPIQIEAGRPPLVETSPSDVEENTWAGYIQSNIETNLFGIPLRGVAGLRVVKTELSVEGVSINEQNELESVSASTDYTDVLPSINLNFAPTEDLLLRFSAAEVLRRPDFDDITPSLNCNPNFTSCETGNTALAPFRSTQYDASAEWYFDDESLISFAVFHKDIKSFLREDEVCLNQPNIIQTVDETRGILINVGCNLQGGFDTVVDPDTLELTIPLSQIGLRATADVNGEGGFVRGFEFGYQQPFTFLPGFLDGFGVIANFTYADSEDSDGAPLEDISKETYNLIGYYEKGPFDARLAYTSRTRFLEDSGAARIADVGVDLGNTDDPTRGNSFREPIKRLDFSASYDLRKNITATFSATNLTDERDVLTASQGQLYSFAQLGRRFTFGVRGRF